MRFFTFNSKYCYFQNSVVNNLFLSDIIPNYNLYQYSILFVKIIANSLILKSERINTSFAIFVKRLIAVKILLVFTKLCCTFGKPIIKLIKILSHG